MSQNIIKYRESNGKKYPSIVSMPRSPLPENVKQKVVKYLLNEDFITWRTYGVPINSPFDGQPIYAWDFYLEDGVYGWQDALGVYVLQNDVELPDEFVQHVLDFYDNGGTVRVEKLRQPEM